MPYGKPGRGRQRVSAGGLVETGYVTPDGLLLEIHGGPASATEPADVKAGELRRRALVTGGAIYRDDGDGWYLTDRPPGLGLDPEQSWPPCRACCAMPAQPLDADLAAAEGELGRGDPTAVRAITAAGVPVDIPGVISAGGAASTELTSPLAFTFDAAGRLTSIVAAARNTGFETYDLLVATEITLHYDDVPTTLPDPAPLWAGADDLNTVP